MTDADDPIIVFDHVTKRYHLHPERSHLRAALPGRFGEARDGEVFCAADDVCFEVRRGESIGIIGENGAGKSTLLKMLAGIVTPTSGRIVRPRDVTSIIELGVGFNLDLSGLENLRYGGAFLGRSPEEIEAQAEDILAFAELEAFADMPVKRYSTGMLARLGFALATASDADVFVVDEVLSVGDWGFQRKSMARMRELNERGATIVFVSHNLWIVSQLCERAVLLEHGKVAAIGPTQQVLAAYLGHTPYLNDLASSGGQLPEALGLEGGTEGEGAADVVALATGALGADGLPYAIDGLHFEPAEIEPGGAADLVADVTVHHPVEGARLLVGAYWEGFAGFSEPDELPGEVLQQPGTHRIRVHYPMMACCPSVVAFQMAVVGPEEPDDPEQVLPHAIVKVKTDLRVLGKVTSRPGVWLPREVSVDAEVTA